ncbi:MAG: DUF5618 family protein [candidate division WOR-3 bacterium]
MPKTKIPLTPEGRLELAKRYLKTAKEELRKAGIDRVVGRYIDLKHISSACGIAYLVALEALKALFISKGLISSEELNQRLKKVEGYYKGLKEIKGLGKDRDILLGLFDDVYTILHISGYYRELQSKKSIDDGFEKVEKIIKIVEKHINGKPTPAKKL